MVTYEMSVERQVIYGAEKFSIAANVNETIAFRFHFDRNWRVFDSKAAIFKNSDGEYYIIEIKHDRVTVPWEVLTKDRDIELSIIGFENEVVITTKKITIPVSSSLLPEDYKTFSPSETLFDRFKKECTAKAFLDYEDEIKNLKTDYEKKIFALNEEIEKKQQENVQAISDKNSEIATLVSDYTDSIAEKDATLQNVRNQLTYANSLAEKWNMVNSAMSQKKAGNTFLWSGGSKGYKLPDIDTSSVTAFTASNFDDVLEEIGLDLTSITKFEQIFLYNKGLKKIRLNNTQNVTNFNGAFEGSKQLREVTVGDLDNCVSLYHLVCSIPSLEKVTLGKTVNVEVYDAMFRDCIALREIDAEFDMTSMTSCSSLFSGCYNLEKVAFKPNTIKKSIDVRSSVNLSKESMMSLINGLNDTVTGSLYLSNIAFENNFPTIKEQDKIYEIIMDEKGWAVGLY